MDSSESPAPDWPSKVGSFSPVKYLFRVKARPTTFTIPEAEEVCSSSKKLSIEASDDKSSDSEESSRLLLPRTLLKHIAESSTDSTDMSASSPSSSRTISSTCRMENGERLPRLASGIYHRKPVPILDPISALPTLPTGSVTVLPHPSDCSPVEMRGPPPTWQPPPPPDKDHDYENNYEDAEGINRDVSRDLLLTNPPIYNSYEMSLSQQRRSAREPAAPPLEDWNPDSTPRVLHKNSEGAYYIPGGSVRTNTSTLSPASQIRYHDQCQSGMSSVPLSIRGTRSDPTSTLLKFNTTASLTQPKKRRSPSVQMEKKPQSEEGCTSSLCLVIFLAIALFISLICIVMLLFRSPAYVYSELSPSSSSSATIAYDEKSLRPLPSSISFGRRVDADIAPKHMSSTELFISRAGRVSFNISVAATSQLVLLARHSVPPSLSLHDIFQPLRNDRISSPISTHSVDSSRRKRQTSEIVAVRHVIFEHFLVDGRWHISLINERNRVEPLSMIINSVIIGGEGKCENGCGGHGECIQGYCKCTVGYTGDACEEPVCPTVCSGNGVFSGGICICRPGFKGKECDVRSNWCEPADCNGHGQCTSDGICRCDKQWTGEACNVPACPHPSCNDRGVCVDGKCYCVEGWRGTDCSLFIDIPMIPRPSASVSSLQIESPTRTVIRNIESPIQSKDTRPEVKEKMEEVSPIVSDCSHHGEYINSSCKCHDGWTGHSCQQESCSSCINGICDNGRCICQSGWIGKDCSNRQCAIGCEEHGICLPDGKCQCWKGWNGDNCYQQGCPLDCSGQGVCQSTDGIWKCQCHTSYTGSDCAVPMETDCYDGLDNDNDGLTDCDDPECCSASECQSYCPLVSSPNQVLIRMPAVLNANFYQRVMFLIKNASVQSYTDSNHFNESMVSVIRGRVMWNGGARSESTSTVPFAGVRVWDALRPLYGFTLSREDGEFDLLVNGGRTVNLQYLKLQNHFLTKKRSVYVPPNEIVYVDDFVMVRENNGQNVATRSECILSNRQLFSPTVREMWRMGVDQVDVEGSKILVDSRSVIESIPLPGSSLRLVYDSSRISSSSSSLIFGLLGDEIPSDLRIIHLDIRVAGRRFQYSLAAVVNLTHIWSWNKQNSYRQKEHGLLSVNIRIGYEYRNCSRDNEIMWIDRYAQVEGSPSRLLEGGAWSISVHHYLDVVNNILEMGNGGRRIIGKTSPVAMTIAGGSTKRERECEDCNTNVHLSNLFRPSALAHGLDESLIIGDHNLIRRVDSHGNFTTLLSLSAPDTTYPYYLAINPVDGSLCISLPHQKQIWKILSFQPNDPNTNHEVIAGDGSSCASASDACGDGGLAIDSQLFFPKGIAFDQQGNLYVADGRRLRVIESGTGIMRSIGDSSFDKPPACQNMYGPLSNLQLEWPTSISVHLPTANVYILDSNVVYQIDLTQQLSTVVLGSLSTCINSSVTPIKHVKDIAIGNDGSVYILETDGKKLNQIRRLSSDRSSISLSAGGQSACSCDIQACDCDGGGNHLNIELPSKDISFNFPTAISIDSHDNLYVADTINAKVKKIYSKKIRFDETTRQYHVLDTDRNMIYYFNRHGLHTASQSLITGTVLFNFTYNVDTSLGRLTSIHGAGGLQLRVIRTDETHTSIETPDGQRTTLIINMYSGMIESVQTGVDEPIRLNYTMDGLLTTKSTSVYSSLYLYDEHGRINKVRRGNEEFCIEEEEMIGARLITRITRNKQPYAILSSRDSEFIYDAGSTLRVISMDSGFSVTLDGISSLLDSQSHPLHNTSIILKQRTTVEAISNPPRRELTSRFDWRPYVKKGRDRKVAEVNGVNLYAIEYDRLRGRDVVKSRTEEELMFIEYTENGDIKAIRQGGQGNDETEKVANLTAKYDSLGRRNELRWGDMWETVAYDRQNRIVERNEEGGVVCKYGYFKEGRSPSYMEQLTSIRHSFKYDSKGRLKEATTPLKEVHQFSSVSIGRGLVMKRRYSFTKKPFLLLVGIDGEIIEWTTADEQHEYSVQRDVYGRIIQMRNDGARTSFVINKNGRPESILLEESSKNLTWQGPLMVAISERRNAGKGFKDSSFLMEYDDSHRLISIQAAIEGTALESIQFAYDEKSSLLSSISGYDILRESTILRIQGHRMTHESTFDEHGLLKSRKLAVGDIRLSHSMNRDKAGRVVASEWKTSSAEIREVIEVDVMGRIASLRRNEDRWRVTFNVDGRPTLMNDITFEWLSGGVPKKAGKQEYTVDGNGWTIGRDNISFDYDGIGRIIFIRSPSYNIRLIYDEKNRITDIIGDLTCSLYYGLPAPHSHLVTHFICSDRQRVATILYTDDGVPFSMSMDGYRYTIITDENRSLRFVFSDSAIVKEVHRDPFGSIVANTDVSLWIPIGYLGGIDIPEASIVIIRGRPYDTVLGRYMSFGPEQIQRFSFRNIGSSLDLFSLEDNINPLSLIRIPTDMPSWFRLIGLSPILIPPNYLGVLNNGYIMPRSIASFPLHLDSFSTILSVSPSPLLDSESSSMIPSDSVDWSVDDPGFAELILLTSDGNKTVVDPLLVTNDELDILINILGAAKEMNWHRFSNTWERHFIREDVVPAGLVSSTFPHFTLVVARNTAELRSSKSKILVHFSTNERTVRAELVEDLRRREGSGVWKSEKRSVEKGRGRHAWTDREKRELLSKGSVEKYNIELDEDNNLLLPTIHQWRFVKN